MDRKPVVGVMAVLAVTVAVAIVYDQVLHVSRERQGSIGVPSPRELVSEHP
jgi:hypothetical protein